MDASLWKFIWGALGAVAPEALRWFRIATGKTRQRVTKNIPFYIFATIFWIAIGGAFAVAWGEENPYKCIWVGASLPVIISGLAAQAPLPPG